MPPQEESPRCAECSACSPGDGQPDEGPQQRPGGGWGWGAAIALMFLGPVVLATLGAIWAGDNPDAQLFGAVAGLGVGAAASVGIVKLVQRAGTKGPTP